MVYIKLEDNAEKFMMKYKNLPKAIQKISFKSRCRNGKFKIEKVGNRDYIILPEINDRILKKLKNMSSIKCWRNICISENLRENNKFKEFAQTNNLNIMDGKWLFKNIADKVIDYIVEMNNDTLINQEISILCNQLDETILEKIKEIAIKVKVCNILTNNIKQYKKLESEMYQTFGVALNISNNYRKTIAKSNIVINFDFLENDLKKCAFPKNAYMVDINNTVNIDKKETNERIIISYDLGIPEKYGVYKEILTGFRNDILYESFIYKHTSYRNIKKELIEDEIKILYLIDLNYKIKATDSNSKIYSEANV